MASYAQQNKVTHAGVAVNNWAGDFECSVCRRKRLTASEFSKKMQERYKKDGNGALKCKICVDKAAADERAAAAAKVLRARWTATRSILLILSVLWSGGFRRRRGAGAVRRRPRDC
mgnify:CR=1 FL=1